jgi:hypothetical protein
MTHPIQSYFVTSTIYIFLAIFIYAITRNALTHNTWFVFDPPVDKLSLGGSVCYLLAVLPSLIVMLIYPIISLITKKVITWAALNIIVSPLMCISSISGMVYLYAYNADVSKVLGLSLTFYFIIEFVLSFALFVSTFKTLRAYSDKPSTIDMENLENPPPTTSFIPSDDSKHIVRQHQYNCKIILYIVGSLIYAPLLYHIFYMYTHLSKYQSSASDDFFAIGFYAIPIILVFLYACVKRLRIVLRFALVLFNVANWFICMGIADGA